MGEKRRLEAEDTVDPALRLLMGLQADGWGVTNIEVDIEHARETHKARRRPIETTVTIKLRPA
jgi:hypothetical protein